MAESAATAGSALTLGKRPDRTHRSLRHELAHEYEAAYGQTCRRDTLDALEAIVTWLRRVERIDGVSIFRSMPQVFSGVGWPTTGNVKADRSRHRDNLARRLDMLVRMGVLEGWEPHYKANREGRGILVRLRRDSSVGQALPTAASSRRPPRRPGPPSPPVAGEGPRRRFSSSSRVRPPLREKDPRNRSKSLVVVVEQQSRDARARRRLSGHNQITRFVARHLAEAGEDGGAELVQAAPWLADVPVSCLLRAAVLVFAPRPGSGWAKHWTLRISAEALADAERHAAMLDHYDGRGAGAAAIINLAAGGWRIHRPSGRPPRFPEPRTPGLLCKGLRKRARLSRDLARFRADYAAAATS